MACDLTLGRLEVCHDQNGGLKAIYFINYASGLETTATFDANNQITAFASALTLFKYELRGGNNSFEETNEKSRENGTSFWTQTGTVSLKKQAVASHKELRIATHGTPQVVFEDYNGNFFLAGLENGCSVSVSTTTGTGMGDFTGYNLTITGQESQMATFITPSIIDDTTNTSVTEGA